MSFLPASVFAPTNIALLKYWGKDNRELNTATHPSISMTLDRFGSHTEVYFSDRIMNDELILNGKTISCFPKVSKVLDALRSLKETTLKAHITSTNNFPTAAGLASSASGIASVTYAASLSLGLDLTANQLAVISRMGSGSSSRSFLGGFVEWNDNNDPIISQILQPSDWPLDIYLVLLSKGTKMMSSTDAMIHSQKTSRFFSEWVQKSLNSYMSFKEAIVQRDFKMLSLLSEKQSLLLHKTILTSEPPVIYWNDQTLVFLKHVRDWQRDGLEVFFTIDAGPNIILVCEKSSSLEVQSRLEAVQTDFLRTEMGTGPKLISGPLIA